MYHDVWELDIKRAIPSPKETDSGTYAIVISEGKPLEKISMREACNFLCDEFHKHREQQLQLEQSQTSHPIVVKCGVDGCHQLRGSCMKHLQTQWGNEIFSRYTSIFTGVCGNVQDNASQYLDVAREFYNNYTLVPLIPFLACEWSLLNWFSILYYRDDLIRMYRSWSCAGIVFFLNFLTILTACFRESVYFPCVFTLVCLVWAYFQVRLVNFVKYRFFDELRQKQTLTHIHSAWQNNIVRATCAGASVLGAMYMLAKAYKSWKSLNLQGSLEPLTQQDIDLRDAETNVWTPIAKRELPITDYSGRMSVDHLNCCVSKALVYGTIHLDGQNGMMNGLMVSSNVIVVPDHYFSEFGDVLECTFRKSHPDASGGKFVGRLCKSASYLVPGTDIRICYIPTGGSYKNLVNFFPVGDMPSVPFQMQWRKRDGELILAKGLTQPGVVRTVKSFPGGMYKNLTINTFDGLCGATLVSETNGSVILGIHLGGAAGTPRGCYGSITQQDLARAFEALRSIEGVVLSGGAGKFETQVLGVQVLKSDALHNKSPLNYLPNNSQVEYFGSCPGRSVTKTSVQVTPISAHIIDVCGIPNIYRGPKFHPEWFGWQECLANLAVPAHPYPHELLSLAIRDYKAPLLTIFAKSMWRSARPLTDQENLCGIPGRKFMDAIKLNTSVGFPLTGPKRAFVTELEPTDDFPNNRVLDAILMDEIRRIEECYKRGERGYPIAKACKKDEILTKDKCRIFYGNALSLTFLIRKYYLPLLRVLQMNPLVSECAVGINSHGPEWEEFHQHVMQFGEDRLFGGDYGKYDQKLPSQLIFAAMRILIDCARVCKYSEADISAMEAMTGDIVYAYIAYNGDLIGLTEGTHISGNSLTVIINGICGSLNLRCFFYSMYPAKTFEERMIFRDYVAAMTYGDDNIGSVRRDIDKFTIKGCSEFLAKYGQVYTMPDKESDLLDFLPPDEFEFLKRFSVYHPALGRHVGALLDKSIYKSLHCFMREKNDVMTKEEACAQNIDGALREWFNHGEDKFEKQRTLMTEVAKRSGISHMCSGLDVSYSDRVAEWQHNYGEDAEH
jgi:hypothetical protein